MSQNRLWNTKNPHQGEFKKVLCVCSAGLLRSPTVAWILSNPPFNFNTRAVGMSADYSLIPIDKVHIAWADAIVCVSGEVHGELLHKFGPLLKDQDVCFLDLPDKFAFRDPQLVAIASQQLLDAFNP